MPELNKIYHGKCEIVLKDFPADYFDSIVTDPPYGINFMGKKWDYDVPSVEQWQECLRVLKPGGYLLSFAGTRTQHRMACNIEDAGFEIRDLMGLLYDTNEEFRKFIQSLSPEQIKLMSRFLSADGILAWVYGSGFPKSLDISKAIDKAAGLTREKIAVGGPVKRMIPGADQDKTGSWIKDNGREYQPGIEIATSPEALQWEGWGTALKPGFEPITMARKPIKGTVAANVLKYGTGGINIDGCRIDLDGIENHKTEGKSGLGKSIYGKYRNLPKDLTDIPRYDSKGRFPANLIHDGSGEVLAEFPDSNGQQGDVRGTEKSHTGDENTHCYGEFNRVPAEKRNDSGSAARFFYCAKSSKKDRNGFNKHPTVKPIALMKYLIKLVTPPKGIILDPFAGSGSTCKAAVEENFKFVGVEKEQESVTTANKRMETAELSLF